jgi:hypothetical protein
MSSWTLEVRGGVVLANQFGSIVSCHDPRRPAVSTLVGRSTNRHHHKSPWGLTLQPSSTHYNNSRQASSSPTESRHHRAHLVADLIHHGSSLSSILLHNQDYPKVCPDSLNPLNAGNSFAGISSLSSCYLFSPTRDLIALV